MGDIADMILDGQMCQTCGEILGQGDGYPVFCRACMPDNKRIGPAPPNPKKTNCPICNKRVKKTGLGMHMSAVHRGEK